MLNSGRLLEASDLAIDYINAVLGSGLEHFGLETPLVATAPPTWLPFNTIEVLLKELEDINKDLNKDSIYVEVNSKISIIIKCAHIKSHFNVCCNLCFRAMRD